MRIGDQRARPRRRRGGRAGRSPAARCGGRTLNDFLALGRPQWSAVRRADHRAADRRGAPGRRRAAAAARSPRSSWSCRSRSATTSTSTPRSTTPPTSGGSSGPDQRAAAAELEAPAGRLPRPGRHGRRLRHRRSSGRAGSGATGRRPGLRAVDAARHRGRGRLRRRRAEPRWARAVPVDRFADHVFGVVLVNDWSARDIQAVGVPAARAVPRQVVRHLDLAVGGAARRARRRLGAGAGAGPAGAADYLRDVPHLGLRPAARGRAGTARW